MKFKILGISLLSGSLTVLGQSISGGSISGNMESTFQYLKEDTLIGATQPDEKALLNTYMNVFYTNGGIKAGIRAESYLPRIQGYPNRFDGTGIGMRYAGYANDFVDITVGNFYEQFGSGMIFRAYEDRNLGYDNSVDGLRLILKPMNGVTIKGIYGNQRYSFQGGQVIKSAGLTRGVDGEVNLNAFFHGLDSIGLGVKVGGSFVSKYQKDDNETYVLPENVGSYGGRLDLRYKRWGFNAEYIHKENDPSEDNQYIYNSGHAAIANLTYSRKGFGFIVSAKSVDNMSYRSDRTKNLQDLFINYLPALNKTHTYNLVATLYPYATQPLGEIAYQAEMMYTIPKGSKLGGKYGIPIDINYSTAFLPIRRTAGYSINDTTRISYLGKPFDKSDSLLWQDINMNITYKFNKNLYVIGSYFNITINNDVSKVTEGAKHLIQSHIGVAEIGYKINKKNSIRTEFQGLWTKKDKGNWATMLVEYTISPHWFFAFMDQYNYGNSNKDLRLHYMIGTVGYVKGVSRIAVSYGKQRAGLFCVGGVCRFVPANNGLTVTFSQSF